MILVILIVAFTLIAILRSVKDAQDGRIIVNERNNKKRDDI